MSRYHVEMEGTTLVYGYDRPLQEYFAHTIDADGEEHCLVGMMSPLYGSASNLVHALTEMNALHLIPAEHQIAIGFDLPF